MCFQWTPITTRRQLDASRLYQVERLFSGVAIASKKELLQKPNSKMLWQISKAIRKCRISIAAIRVLYLLRNRTYKRRFVRHTRCAHSIWGIHHFGVSLRK